MIRAQGLTKRFGRHRVFDGLDLSVGRGERVAVLGLNGAGKTTLMRCLLGLLPYEGGLTVGGCDVRLDGVLARARIGYVPQRAPHFEGTLADTVGFFSRLRGVAPRTVESKMAELGLRLADHGDTQVRALSGGTLQKVLLALALATDVPVLLLDEPTANLDAHARQEFLQGLERVARETTILLASHRLADVAAVADRLVVLHEGSIAFDGDMAQLHDRIGAAQTLWVRVSADDRELARRQVQQRFGMPSFVSNGSAFGVRVARHARADVLVGLREAGIPVQDFWTESPPLSELLAGVVGPGRPDPASSGPRREEP